MHIVDINNIQPFNIIPRSYNIDTPICKITNEETDLFVDDIFTYTITDGIMEVENIGVGFYENKGRYTITITNRDGYILYRGKILCLDNTDTQNIKQSTDYYVYE